MIATVTIGQSPRDDVVPEIKELMGVPGRPGTGSALPAKSGHPGQSGKSGQRESRPVKFLEFGALDDLGEAEIQALSPGATEEVLVTRLRDGRQIKLSEARIYPLLGQKVSQAAECAHVVMLLCTGSFGGLTVHRPLLRPDRILLSTALAVAGDGRIGIITPDESQCSQQVERWSRAARQMGFATAISVAPASPYRTGPGKGLSTAGEGVEIAARTLSSCDILVLDCIGYTLRMKDIARAASGRPVLLARSVLARVAAELVF